jgi:hypothetical protein
MRRDNGASDRDCAAPWQSRSFGFDVPQLRRSRQFFGQSKAQKPITAPSSIKFTVAIIFRFSNQMSFGIFTAVSGRIGWFGRKWRTQSVCANLPRGYLPWPYEPERTGTQLTRMSLLAEPQNILIRLLLWNSDPTRLRQPLIRPYSNRWLTTMPRLITLISRNPEGARGWLVVAAPCVSLYVSRVSR